MYSMLIGFCNHLCVSMCDLVGVSVEFKFQIGVFWLNKVWGR